MKLSIITINYNNLAGLKKTVERVLAQRSREFEYIIVDGGSNDGSSEYVTNLCSDYIPLKCVSEPDSGIYNAMNKGIQMAKGEYVHFLNSGDWLVNGKVVEQMLRQLQVIGAKNSFPDVFVGNKITIRPDGKMKRGNNKGTKVSAYTFYRGTVEHTSAYIRRAMFDTVGMYDEHFRIVSDWKWYLEALIYHNAVFVFTDIFVSYFDNTGISSVNLKLDKQERRAVLEKVFHPAVLADYDRFYLQIEQVERLKKYPLVYWLFYFVERVLFKFEKWKNRIFEWRITSDD